MEKGPLFTRKENILNLINRLEKISDLCETENHLDMVGTIYETIDVLNPITLEPEHPEPKRSKPAQPSYRKITQVRLTNYQYESVQKIACYLHTDVSSIIRSAIEDAIETLNRWTNLDLITEIDLDKKN